MFSLNFSEILRVITLLKDINNHLNKHEHEQYLESSRASTVELFRKKKVKVFSYFRKKAIHLGSKNAIFKVYASDSSQYKI